jgi:YbbR domain-containing protein
LILDSTGPAADQVASVDSLLFARDPFPIVNAVDALSAGSDRNTRVVVFVRNLQLAQGEAADSVVVEVIDENGQKIDVAAEAVRSVSNTDFVQVIFRLPSRLVAGTCTVRVKAHGQTSNAGTMRIRI